MLEEDNKNAFSCLNGLDKVKQFQKYFTKHNIDNVIDKMYKTQKKLKIDKLKKDVY